jgi:hypothetical protein
MNVDIRQDIEDGDEINLTRPWQEASEEYKKEIVLVGVNKSVYLKTNERNVSLKNMLELGQKALNNVDNGGG